MSGEVSIPPPRWLPAWRVGWLCHRHPVRGGGGGGVEVAASQRSWRAAIFEYLMGWRKGQRWGAGDSLQSQVRNYATGANHPPPTVAPSTLFWRFAQKNLFSCACQELLAKASNSGILVVFFDPRKVRALVPTAQFSRLFGTNCTV